MHKKGKNYNELVEKVQKDLEGMRKVKGGEYVLFLMKHENKEIPYFYLEHCISENQELCLDNYFDYKIIDGSIQYLVSKSFLKCDDQTCIEVKSRLETVINKIQIAEEYEYVIELVDLNKEKRSLIRYLSEVMTPTGGIRYFSDNIRKSQKSVTISIKRFLDEYRKIDEETAKIIDKRLLISKWTVRYRGA